MRTCLRKIGILVPILAVAVIGITGCPVSVNGSSPIDGFLEIPGTSITGGKTWTPTSKVFVSGRALKINSFYMCDHEVTQAEYKEVMGSNPSTADAYDKDGNKLMGEAAGKNPVNDISWYDAIVYCNRLFIKENLKPCYKIGGSTNPDDWEISYPDNPTWDAATCDFDEDGYRLPTEAEWEWAARGGAQVAYRGYYYPSDRHDGVGFRLVRSSN